MRELASESVEHVVSGLVTVAWLVAHSFFQNLKAILGRYYEVEFSSHPVLQQKFADTAD